MSALADNLRCKCHSKLPSDWTTQLASDITSIQDIIAQMVTMEYTHAGIVTYGHCHRIKRDYDRNIIPVYPPGTDYGTILSACGIIGLDRIDQIKQAIADGVDPEELDKTILRANVDETKWTQVRLEFFKNFDKYYYRYVWHCRYDVMDFNSERVFMSMDGFNDAFWRARDEEARKGNLAKKEKYKKKIAAQEELYRKQAHELAAVTYELETLERDLEYYRADYSAQ